MTLIIPAASASTDLAIRTAFIASLREARAMGWKPSKTEQSAIDAFFKKAPGKASEKPVKSAKKAAAKESKSFRRNGATVNPVEVLYRAGNGGKLLQRSSYSSLSEAHKAIGTRLQHFPEGTVTVEVKHHHLQDKVEVELASGKRNEAAHAKPVSDRKAERKVMVVHEEPEAPVAKSSPKGNEAVKVALQAALQGMTASMTAIQAAINAL